MKIENIKFKAKRLDNGNWAEGSLVTTKLLGLDEPMTEIIAIDGTWMHDCIEWDDCKILIEKFGQKNK